MTRSQQQFETEMANRQQQFENGIQEQITALRGTVETNQTAVQEQITGLQKDVASIRADVTAILASIAALRAEGRNTQIDKGKKPEDPPSSGVTAQQLPPVDLTGEGEIGDNPAGSTSHSQFTFHAG